MGLDVAKCSKCVAGVCETPQVEPPKSPCPEVCEIPSGGECSFHPEFVKRQHHVNLCRNPKKRYRQYWSEVYGDAAPSKKTRKKREPYRKPIDTTEWFTARYNAAGVTSDPTLPELLAKLARCRSAGCPHLLADVCTRWRGATCLSKHRERWFEKLMLRDCDQWT